MEDHIQKTSNDNREILSVSEVNQAANDFLNEAFPPLWIVGEISNFKEYGSSGHWYFSLKDSDSVLSAAMFRLQNIGCLLYTSPSPRDAIPSRMPSSA